MTKITFFTPNGTLMTLEDIDFYDVLPSAYPAVVVGKSDGTMQHIYGMAFIVSHEPDPEPADGIHTCSHGREQKDTGGLN